MRELQYTPQPAKMGKKEKREVEGRGKRESLMALRRTGLVKWLNIEGIAKDIQAAVGNNNRIYPHANILTERICIQYVHTYIQYESIYQKNKKKNI